MSVGLPAVWRDYRSRRRSLLGTAAVGLIIAAAGAPFPGTSGTQVSSQHLLLALWATSFVAAVVWFAGFRCPYCTRPFHWTWLVANPLSRECLHCGFAKWRDPQAARNYRSRANDG
jgi:Zn ribbon nucleic-acid-binding protein